MYKHIFIFILCQARRAQIQIIPYVHVVQKDCEILSCIYSDYQNYMILTLCKMQFYTIFTNIDTIVPYFAIFLTFNF